MYVSVHQTLRAMQLAALLLTVCCLTVSAGTLSQSNITYSGKDVKLETVFQAVKSQTGYFFIYNNDVISKAHLVTVNAKNIPLQEFMEIVLRGQDLEWMLQKTTIVIQKKKQEKKVEQVEDVVTGIVRGPDGAPLAGVNISIKGTKRGTITDSDGTFKISAEKENVLEISAIGFGKKEIKLKGAQQVVVTLEIASSVLDEVQYIAYGQTTRRYSVGNTATIKAVDIEKQPVQNPLVALQGRVPGLFVVQNTGIAGGNVKINIQGQNSLLNGSDPLYVIDGVPIDATLPRTSLDGILGGGSPSANAIGNGVNGVRSGWGNPLNYINPGDIESIDILKDADATAIFGSRAANGAILITTKKGKAGAMKFDVNVQQGQGRMTRRMDMMNTRQYLDMRYEAFRNDNIDWRKPSVAANDLKLWDTTRYTNWQDELLGGVAKYNNISASLSGGPANVRYLISGNYHKETTVFPLPGNFADQKASVHFNLNANNSDQKLKVQFSGNYMFDNNELPQTDFTQTALMLEPNAPTLLNADGSINWAPDASGNSSLSTAGYSTMANPLTQRYLKYVNKTYNLISSLKLDYSIFEGLNIASNFGYTYTQTNDFAPNPLMAIPPEERPTKQRQASFGDRNIQSWIIEPQASYQAKIYNGTLDLLTGSTFQNKTAEANAISGSGQLNDELLGNISAAAVISKGYSNASHYRYNAVFGRAVYNWMDKYIASVNLRRDGSTRFGANNRFHNFGSVGAAWLFSNESFFKSRFDLISFGKLRGSYGTTGNDQIGDFQFMSLYSLGTAVVPYQGLVGLQPAGLPNPNLQWEETQKLQIGIDLGIWQDRMVINANFIRNRSSNQLLSYALPAISGYGGFTINFPATVQNQNWEFMVTGKIIEKKELNWTATANATIPKNRLVEFENLDKSTYSNDLIIGQPMDVVRYYHWLGVAPGTGDNLYEGNGHPVLAPNTIEDRRVLISRYSKFYGGLQSTVSYKGIQLDFLFQYVKQDGYNDAAFWNGVRYPGMFAAGNSNQPVTVLDRWQKSGDVNSVARYRTTEVLYIIGSDRRFTDASYISLKNVSLSWNVPKKWTDKAGLKDFRVYAHGQNLIMITKYKGLNPETQSMFYLPPLQVITLGLQVVI